MVRERWRVGHKRRGDDLFPGERGKLPDWSVKDGNDEAKEGHRIEQSDKKEKEGGGGR